MKPFLNHLFTDNNDKPIFKCLNCGSCNLPSERKKVTKGILWWKKKFTVCPQCDFRKYEILVTYRPRL